jgi:hypothetical protein
MTAMYDPPGYLWALTFVGVIGVPALACVVLYRGALRADLGRGRAALLGVAAAVVLGGWLAASAAIAGAGWYHTQLGKQPPWLPIAVVTALVVLLAASRLPDVARALGRDGREKALSVSDTPGRLLLPHTFRVAGLAFLITMVLGHLPALFALPAGLGDIAVGIAAPFVARRLAQGTGHRSALWFNALGIVDLVVALSLGGLTAYQIIQVTPANDAISELPLVLIPTATVPLLLALHIVSIRQLIRASRTPQRTASAVGAAA